MSPFTLILLALSLSVDTFAAALTQGASSKRLKRQHKRRIAAIFTACAITAPAIGYTIGHLLSEIIDKIDHWIAFILLSAVGLHMAYNGLFHKEEKPQNITNTRLFLTAVATNIDAVAVGIGLAFINDINIISVCLTIGLATISATYLGLTLGKRTSKFLNLGPRAEIIGGVVLTALGLKILLQHLYF